MNRRRHNINPDILRGYPYEKELEKLEKYLEDEPLTDSSLSSYIKEIRSPQLVVKAVELRAILQGKPLPIGERTKKVLKDRGIKFNWYERG